MVTYEELLQRQLIKKLEKSEKEKYVSFHLLNYEQDLKSAVDFIDIKNSKYAVIAGYYAVLNSTLWYFAKYFSLKISEEDVGVHTNCLIVMEHFVKDKKLKERIIYLLEGAKKEFTSFTVLKKHKEDTLPVMLKHSAEKRKKYTYYSADRNLPQEDNQLHEAEHFLETVVKPYISIMEKIQC